MSGGGPPAHRPEAIDGFLLPASSAVIVLDSCGSTTAPANRLASTAIGAALAGAPMGDVPGGSYRLCWCAAGDRCPAPVDVGALIVVGPDPLAGRRHRLGSAAGQDRTCVSGQVHIGERREWCPPRPRTSAP